jgi:tetratricopeptide (TPR) repeat protein
MRKILLFIILTFLPAAIMAQGQSPNPIFDLSNYGVKIEAEKRVIIVLAALEMAKAKNAAGENVKLINTPLSESGQAFRDQLIKDNAGLNEDLRVRISAFVIQYMKRHPKASDAEIVSPFISMAYALSPPPEMFDPSFTGDLPGDLLDVLDFAPLAREFYRRSGISARLDDYIKLYRTESDIVLRPSAREMVSELLDYMHTKPEIYYVEKIKIETQKSKSKSTVLSKIETRERERRFVIVPEMLAPVGTVNFLNIKDDYYVVVPPNKDLSYSDVRRGFIRFVVDPLILKNGKEVTAIKDAVKPLLDERRKSDPSVSPDVFLTVSRSLVAAIDAREIEYSKSRIATQQARNKIATLKTDAEKRAVSAQLEKYLRTLSDDTALQLSEAYERGAVMAFYFADELKGTEDSGFDIAASVREMIATFDATKEGDRLAQNAEAAKRALVAREERKNRPVTEESVADNPVTVRLLDIQKTIEAKNYVKAGTDLRTLLNENPNDPRIYYNLGRVASLSAEGVTDPDLQADKLKEAKIAYSNAIKVSTKDTDKALLSLTYVALARIFEFFNDNGTAIQLYDRGIQIGNVTGGAFNDAVAGKQNLLQKP